MTRDAEYLLELHRKLDAAMRTSFPAAEPAADGSTENTVRAIIDALPKLAASGKAQTGLRWARFAHGFLFAHGAMPAFRLDAQNVR